MQGAGEGPGCSHRSSGQGAAPGKHEPSLPSWPVPAAPEAQNTQVLRNPTHEHSELSSAAHRTPGEALGVCCGFFLFKMMPDALNAPTCPDLRAPHLLPFQKTGRSAAPALPTAQGSTLASPEGRNASPTKLPLDLLSSNTSHLNSFKAWPQQLFTPSTRAMLQSPDGSTWTVNLFCL